MADATRLPEGIIIEGDLSVARPVDTIVRNTADGLLYVSTDGATPSYEPLTAAASQLDVPVLADPGDGGTIPGTGSARVYLDVGAGAETMTLDRPAKSGLYMFINMNNDGGGSRAVTVTGSVYPTGNSTATFDAAGDLLILEGIELRISGTPVLIWRLVENVDVTLS